MAGLTPIDPSAADRLAETVSRGFDRYAAGFKRLTLGARRRFEQRDWKGAREDWVARLDLYGDVVRQTLEGVAAAAGAAPHDRAIWKEAKRCYEQRVRCRQGSELAETFFNSISRRVLGVVGADNEIAFLETPPADCQPGAAPPITRSFVRTDSLDALIAQVLESYPFSPGYEDVRRDAALIARTIEEQAPGLDRIEMAAPVFFRNKGAYLIGRMWFGDATSPLVVALLNSSGRVAADAVLTTEDEASIVFSFTRSYFFVDTDCPGELVAFLAAIMPRKPIADLYAAIGHHRHGKTEIYRSLRRHLAGCTDRFDFARGARGMVMIVFAMPPYDLIFKVVRDYCAEPKTCTRRDVMAKYDLVFKHDRAGRLIDAQTFEQLTLDRNRFVPELLEELLSAASQTVSLEGDRVVFRHVYTERRVTPLDVYLQEAEPAAAREAIIDYGQAVRDLAATNIFPGDLLFKNFGVTRHGRVVFYDYDELALLTDCTFRTMPVATNDEEALAAEPWFHVGEHDIFPEEFLPFLGLKGDLRDAFLASHSPLLSPGFWRAMQEEQRAGRVVDIFPYAPGRRLAAGEPG